MNLLVEYLRKEVEELDENNVIINWIGDISKLPPICQEELIKAKEKTRDNNGLTLNLALNYGGRDEIKRAIINIVKDVNSGKLNVDNIDENTISDYLDTANIPDPDLLIRPSGELRISNFLLWQLAYSELWFSDIYWPDFNSKHLLEAIKDYQKRERRFGAIK